MKPDNDREAAYTIFILFLGFLGGMFIMYGEDFGKYDIQAQAMPERSGTQITCVRDDKIVSTGFLKNK